MIKISGTYSNGTFILLGLSHENVKRLEEGKPISVDLKEMGLNDGHLMIFVGETEQTMEADIRRMMGRSSEEKTDG